MSANGDITDPKAWISAPVLTGLVDPAGSKINLTWTVPSPVPVALKNYLVYRKEDSGAFVLLATLAPNVYAYSDTTMIAPHGYTYYIGLSWANGFQLGTNRVVFPSFIVDLFDAAGAYVWTKRQGTISCDVTVIGGAGGGGSGGGGPPPTSFGGGGGGGGGGFASFSILPSFLAATEAVVVGAGGTGGASVVSDFHGRFGNQGVGGGTSSFGAWSNSSGGQGGLAPTTGSPGAATGGFGFITGAAGPTSKVIEQGGSGPVNGSGANPNSTRSGAAGGVPNSSGPAVPGGVAANSGFPYFGGSGGASGVAGNLVNATPGLPGISPGGGGGGGGGAGASLDMPNPPLTGQGGLGAHGQVAVKSYFW